MQAPVYDFPALVLRGRTYPLGLVAKIQNLFTQQVHFYDLSEATITWTIDNKPSDLVGTTKPNGGMTLTLETSRVDWVLTPEMTGGLTLGLHAYAVNAEFQSGEVVPLLRGRIQVGG